MVKCQGLQKAQAGRGGLCLTRKVLSSPGEEFQGKACLVHLGALEELALGLGGRQEFGMLSQDDSEISMVAKEHGRLCGQGG